MKCPMKSKNPAIVKKVRLNSSKKNNYPKAALLFKIIITL